LDKKENALKAYIKLPPLDWRPSLAR